MKSKTIILSLVIIGSFSVKNSAQQKTGLVGLLYDDIKLTRMSSIWYLESVNSSGTTWQTKHDFSAKWIG
ncbi:hypothetical protein MNBD_IGNAVI01-1671, partial [hydrothermal vent metagenome]